MRTTTKRLWLWWGGVGGYLKWNNIVWARTVCVCCIAVDQNCYCHRARKALGHMAYSALHCIWLGFVHMYVCIIQIFIYHIYACVYIYIHIYYMYVYANVYVHTIVHTWIYKYAYKHTHRHMWFCIYSFGCLIFHHLSANTACIQPSVLQIKRLYFGHVWVFKFTLACLGTHPDVKLQLW